MVVVFRIIKLRNNSTKIVSYSWFNLTAHLIFMVPKCHKFNFKFKFLSQIESNNKKKVHEIRVGILKTKTNSKMECV